MIARTVLAAFLLSSCSQSMPSAPWVAMDAHAQLFLPTNIGHWRTLVCKTDSGTEIAFDDSILKSAGGMELMLNAANHGYFFHAAQAWCAHRNGLVKGV